MLIKCLSFGAPTLTDQYPFDAQKRKTGMLPYLLAQLLKNLKNMRSILNYEFPATCT
ncbi:MULTISPECIES: hypothetical protein [Cyanophyceae]|uniref:hypothetical protein n=1 Tax=Cyanophyceae TaxID=3028117 RepID=UPI0016858202|nr:hypothetical protein [Trichocoleus sp. FACHB-40]MBD2003276.1 hypothetical protein [Trichocoleus sp. FACHB-40]